MIGLSQIQPGATRFMYKLQHSQNKMVHILTNIEYFGEKF